MSSPKVLLLTPDFPPAPGGIQVVAHRLAEHMSRIEVRVVTLGGPGDREFDRGQGFPVKRVGGRRGPHRARVGLLNVMGAVEAVRWRPDVILSLHVVTGPAAALAGRVLGAPVVQYLHADEMRARTGLTRSAIAASRGVIAVSTHTAEMARGLGATPSSTWTIPNGVDLPRHASAERNGDPVVLTVGRLTQRYKGHDVMLDAFSLVRERVPAARWIVVGDGPLRPELEAKASASGLGDAVSFLGAVGDAERDALLDSARVFAMPSRLPAGGTGGEGFGIVFLEASAHGLPVVGGNVGGALDAVVDGETGLLVDPTDPRVLADALADLLAEPERARALGAAGAQRARGYGWPEIARRVEDVLLEVAG